MGNGLQTSFIRKPAGERLCKSFLRKGLQPFRGRRRFRRNPLPPKDLKLRKNRLTLAGAVVYYICKAGRLEHNTQDLETK